MCFQDSSLITVPPFGAEPGIKGTIKGNTGTWASGQPSYSQDISKTGAYKSDICQYDSQQFHRDYVIDSRMAMDNRFLAQNSSFLHTWQTNGRYLQQVKMLTSFAEESEAAC